MLSLFIGCTNTPRAKDGDEVKVHYTGTQDDGTTFDSSREREPLSFVIGSGMMIPGFNDGVIGMAVGDTKTIVLTPDQAYGPRHEERIQPVAISQLPEGMTPTPGAMLQMTGPGGQPLPVRIESVQGDSVIIDANHPLAGKTLTFDVELMEIIEKETP
ncbi:MAG: peptidylprolyl isomerase [FCB group bacterium]|nr:peptidylprolyl isomerase [FCB group bacterium]